MYDGAQKKVMDAFAPKVISILKDLSDRRQLSLAAHTMGVEITRLTEIIKRQKPLTPYFLTLMLANHIVRPYDLLGPDKLEHLDDDTRRVLTDAMTRPLMTAMSEKLVIMLLRHCKTARGMRRLESHIAELPYPENAKTPV
jgi:hypothetical protein